ncbi:MULTISPECIES: hypothetical protein [Asticcacaulis]|uniref:hypothetical protein n=1 Tax=Asticcacaulis TaxID=76890 RepID=UPI001AE75636|nr:MULTISPECIES: hypothetical protein [Asticcacaulis]MBP2161634.1 hypothetical protein [Asticcacaulis solisilvae]MDR6802741.1 hypothetical protein [Asticcacaulis sp. BE141]
MSRSVRLNQQVKLKGLVKRTGAKRRAAYAASIAAIIVALPAGSAFAIAKKGIDGMSKTAIERPILDQNNVDLLSGHYTRTDEHLTIGNAANGGLRWSYSQHTSDAEFIDTYNGKITLDNSVNVDSGKTKVTVSSGSDSFLKVGGTGGACSTDCKNSLSRSSTLVKSGSEYIYTNTSGDVFYFDAFTGNINPPYTGTIARLKRIENANGVKITITYDELGSCALTVGCPYRINSVVTNTGYGLKYEYLYSNSRHLSKVYAVNTTTTTCTFAPLNCSSYDALLNIAHINMFVVDITRPAGGTYRYGILNAFENVEIDVLNYVRLPTGAEFTTTYDNFGRIKTLTTPAGTWGYGYSDTNLDLINSTDGRTTTASNPGGGPARVYNFHKASQLPSNEKNELNQLTVYTNVNVGGALAIGTITKPEGNKITYGYNARFNVVSETHTNKAGDATLVTASDFSATCANMKMCNQPNWTRDAKNNQTDYVYDPTHGGVLTVTLPADQNGLRHRTYNTYTPFDTGNGYIYRLTRTEACGLNSGQLGLAACPTAVTTSVTVTDYGNSTTAPKTYKTFLPFSVTQTDGAGSLSATTAYTYDNVGNVVAVDGPLAGAVDVSYATYDADRRKVCEIGVDPDGAGPLVRTMIRHNYNPDSTEAQTDTGFGSSTTDCRPGYEMTRTSFVRRTFDTLGRLIKTEQVQP